MSEMGDGTGGVYRRTFGVAKHEVYQLGATLEKPSSLSMLCAFRELTLQECGLLVGLLQQSADELH